MKYLPFKLKPYFESKLKMNYISLEYLHDDLLIIDWIILRIFISLGDKVFIATL